MISYKILHTKDMNQNLFDHFIRHQTVVKCWRREHGSWIIRDDPFTDDWSEDDYRQLISHCLRCFLSEYFKKICIGGYAENGNWKDALGCVDTRIYSRKHVEEEPYDCQMEYVL